MRYYKISDYAVYMKYPIIEPLGIEKAMKTALRVCRYIAYLMISTCIDERFFIKGEISKEEIKSNRDKCLSFLHYFIVDEDEEAVCEYSYDGVDYYHGLPKYDSEFVFTDEPPGGYYEPEEKYNFKDVSEQYLKYRTWKNGSKVFEKEINGERLTDRNIQINNDLRRLEKEREAARKETGAKKAQKLKIINSQIEWLKKEKNRNIKQLTLANYRRDVLSDRLRKKLGEEEYEEVISSPKELDFNLKENKLILKRIESSEKANISRNKNKRKNSTPPSNGSISPPDEM